MLTVVKWNNSSGSGNLLDEVYTLWVVFPLDFLVVRERSMGRRGLSVVKSGGIEANGVLLASEILDVDSVRHAGPILGPFARRRISIDVCEWL